jgi:hypothetical protein
VPHWYTACGLPTLQYVKVTRVVKDPEQFPLPDATETAAAL